MTAVALSARQGHIAFGTQDGQTKIDSFTKQMVVHTYVRTYMF